MATFIFNISLIILITLAFFLSSHLLFILILAGYILHKEHLIKQKKKKNQNQWRNSDEAVSSSVFISVWRRSIFSFSWLREREMRAESGGNKSRMPARLHHSDSTCPLLLLLCQEMQKYSLHAWGVLSGSSYWSGLSCSTARIDHIDCFSF